MPRKPRKRDVNRLLKDIAADLKQLPSKSTPSTKRLQSIAGEDLYEAYLFMRVLSAARHKGTTVELLGERTRQRAQEIFFRRSPGTLHHTSKKAPDYTFALLKPPGRGHHALLGAHSPLLSDHSALFVGIKALGYSGVTHECDLLLIPFWEAKLAQNRPHYPLWGCAGLYVEAKFNSEKISLPIARALIGVDADLWFDAVVLACHGDLATNAKTYLENGPWQASAAGFGHVQPASPGHNQLEVHLANLF